MNRNALKKLEYEQIREMLKKHCVSELTQKKASELVPVNDEAEVRSKLAETTEGKLFLRKNPDYYLGKAQDMFLHLSQAEKGAILQPEDLLRIRDNCKLFRKNKIFLGELGEEYAILKKIAKDLRIFKTIETRVAQTVQEDGSIRDDASETLLAVRKKIRVYRERVREKLDHIVKNPNNAKYLQDQIVTIRSDRYVIPVKLEYKGKFPGLIHDQSASGATLFIEPMQVVEFNNTLKNLTREEHEEILKIMKELSLLVAQAAGDLCFSLQTLIQLDFILAKAKMSLTMDAGVPEITTNEIKLLRSKHPLLGKSVVPIDILLQKKVVGMVITGPNTGGKTVTLKTLGLLNLMFQSGLHIPVAEHSKTIIFREIFVDIGDEQSIEQSLSTFSSHMVNIVSIMKKADPNSLVLLDELGAGTDPAEGAALAMSILEHFKRRNIRFAATTHYSELKAMAYNDESIVNASVEFDSKTFQPTYRLLIGVPGKSNAFEIARNLGLNSGALEEARTYISSNDQMIADMIGNLEKEKQESEATLKKINDLKQALEQKKQELEAEKQKALREKEKIMASARREKGKIVAEAERKIKKLIASYSEKLEKAFLEGEKLQTKYKDEIKKTIQQEPEDKSIDFDHGEAPKTVEIGQTVYVPKLSSVGKVMEFLGSGNEFTVQVGALKIKLKLKDVRLTKEKAYEQKHYDAMNVIKREKAMDITPKIDLRGENAEEALYRLDKYLDSAYAAGLKNIEIVHGKGTGVLRKSVHEYLREHSLVKEFRIGTFQEGEMGVTIVVLK